MGIQISKILFFAFFIVMIELHLPDVASGVTLEVDYAQSKTSRSTGINADGGFNFSNDETDSGQNIYDWNLGYTRTVSKYSSISETTNHVEAGLGLSTPMGWSFNGGILSETTSGENLRAFGSDLSIGWKTDLPASTEKNIFTPQLALRLDLQSMDYMQNYNVGLHPGGSPSGSNAVNQRSAGLLARWRPITWLRLKAGYSKYFYDRNVSQLAQSFSADPVVSDASPGFSSVLYSLYDSTARVGIYFYLNRAWEVEVSHSSSSVIADGSKAITNRLNLYHSFLENYRAGIGISSSASNDPNSGSSATVTLSLSGDF